jgi:hypothetical protein
MTISPVSVPEPPAIAAARPVAGHRPSRHTRGSPPISVTSAETAPLMIAFHRLLAAGTPASLALAQAQAEVGRGDPAAMAASAGFVSIGTRGQ